MQDQANPVTPLPTQPLATSSVTQSEFRPPTSSTNVKKTIAIIIILLLLAIVGYVVFLVVRPPVDYPGMTPPAASATPAPVGSPTASVTPVGNVSGTTYINPDFKFAFDVKSGEHADFCGFNDTVVAWAAPGTGSAGGGQCGQDSAPVSSVFANRKAPGNTVDEEIAQIETTFAIQKTPISIFGASGYRVTGTQKANPPLPGPTTIDATIVTKNGILYHVDQAHIDRNFRILP